MARYLFRGENRALYEANGGRLIPKAVGQPFKTDTYFGGDVYFGDGSVYGESERNAIIQHQRGSTRHPTSGVSTTPFYENARSYATHCGKYSEGYVFKIDTELLEKCGVTSYAVEEHAEKPKIPGDKEVILVSSDFSALPQQIVVEVEKVT
jgi:hypothetical protein